MQIKQAFRMWFHNLNEALTKLDFKQTKSNYASFFQRQGNTITIILAYMDDLLLIGNNIYKINEIKKKIVKFFSNLKT